MPNVSMKSYWQREQFFISLLCDASHCNIVGREYLNVSNGKSFPSDGVSKW